MDDCVVCGKAAEGMRFDLNAGAGNAAIRRGEELSLCGGHDFQPVARGERDFFAVDHGFAAPSRKP